MGAGCHTLRQGDALPHDLRKQWEAMRGPDTASPYFSPAYAEAVANAGGAPVRVLSSERAVLAVQGARRARPAGAPMSDYHGLIGDTDDLDTLLRAGRIDVLGVQGWTRDSADLRTLPVCRIDLSDGYESWRDSRDSSYSRHAKSHRRRVRKATEEVGEPRFAWASRDVDVFNQLVRWKREQFVRTRKYDVLSQWPRDLIRNLWERRDADVWADLHALYFGDRLAAVDLGLTDGRTFHSWMVAYDPELRNYAPGIQLLEGLVAAPLGYATLDLGVGLEGYKRHYANVEADVGLGTLRAAGARAGLSRLYESGERRVEALARLRRRYTQIAACEPHLSGRVRALADAVGAGLSGGPVGGETADAGQA